MAPVDVQHDEIVLQFYLLCVEGMLILHEHVFLYPPYCFFLLILLPPG